MLENLRKKSLVKTYVDPIYQVCFGLGHAKYEDNTYSIMSYKQKLSKGRTLKARPKIVYTLGHVEFNMIYCPIGTFTMGHEKQYDNEPRLETINIPFLLGETEVTQWLYESVTKKKPSTFKNYKKPVENVSWYDAILFCNELSKLQGLDKCYILTDVSRIDEDGKVQKRIMSAKVTCDFNKNGYRLPTEKEWEYAAKAGTDNRWAGTNDENELRNYAHFWQGPYGSTSEVKLFKKPNEWGFYDMSGNVREWCWDTYEKPKTSDIYSINRGGDWSDYLANSVSSVCRSSSRSSSRFSSIGFRVCRSIVNFEGLFN